MKPNFKVPADWEVVAIHDIADVLLSNVDKKNSANEKPVFLCNYTDVYYNECIDENIEFMQATASENEIEKFSLKKWDIIITKDSETPEDIAVPALVLGNFQNVICGYHLAIIRPDKQHAFGPCLKYLFSLHSVQHYFFTLANGVTRYGLSLGSIKNAILPLPPLREQRKIAKILTTWDKAIEKTEKLIEAKKVLQIGLMRKLLSKKYKIKNKIKLTLGSFLNPVSREVNKPSSSYRALGIRSHGKGTFQRVVEDPNAIEMDTLYQVSECDLIVNITFAWEGAIAIVKKEDEGCLTSHRFPMFRINTHKVLLEYFKYVIKTKYFVHCLGIISPGGAGRNRVLSKKNFLKLEVMIPEIKYQKKVASALEAVQLEIENLSNYLKLIKSQKRGLMQKLLTGQIRVKVYN